MGESPLWISSFKPSFSLSNLISLPSHGTMLSESIADVFLCKGSLRSRSLPTAIRGHPFETKGVHCYVQYPEGRCHGGLSCGGQGLHGAEPIWRPRPLLHPQCGGDHRRPGQHRYRRGARRPEDYQSPGGCEAPGGGHQCGRLQDDLRRINEWLSANIKDDVRGQQTFDLRTGVHVVTAVETPCWICWASIWRCPWQPCWATASSGIGCGS